LGELQVVTKQPNIILIHCHDLGDLFGCYPGNSAITPALNSLASEGVVMDSHFAAAPQCSPSRASMMTGLMPHRHGLMGLQNHGVWNMSTDIPTLANVLRDDGYQTASYGTWHISNDFASHGVDIWNEDALCENATANAVSFLTARTSTSPFFLMLGFFEPHRTYTDSWPDLQDPSSIQIPPYLPDIAETHEEMSLFYGDVSRVDRCVGQILDSLEAENLQNETMLIFTTDHGIAMPLAKGTLYDPGLKIGAIFRWPNQIDPGTRFTQLTSNVDLLPTVLEAIGSSATAPNNLDGISFWDSLTSNKKLPRDALFSEMTWHDFYEPMRSIRTSQYKLIKNFEVRDGMQLAGDIRLSPIVPKIRWELREWQRPEIELYDLHNDPLERHNLAGKPATSRIESALNSQLTDYLESTNDPILMGPIDISLEYNEFVIRSAAGLP
jgi:arylsulfatase A-like enzyme